jgi:hypothetical protein
MKNKKNYYFWAFIIASYLITRLINLTIIPIFTDEAIYSFWAQVALHDPANRFISLEDGKQPLFIWLAAISQKFISDPLIATRLVSVFAGLSSVFGIYLLAKNLFNQKIAQISSILYVILPFTLLYDRLALFDSLLTATGIFSMLFTVKLVKYPKLENSLLLGVSLGLATITKSSGFLFLYLVPVSLILFQFKDKNRIQNFFKWLGFAILAGLISQIIYNSLRLSELFYLIERKNTEFIRSFSEVINNPLESFYSNSTTIYSWIISYIGLPLFVLFVLGIILGLFKKKLQIILLSAYIFAPFLAESLFNKVLYPRFVLFYFPFIIIIIAAAISNLINLKRKYNLIVIGFVLLMLIIPLHTSFKLLTDPKNARIAISDSNQYINDWPAGFGVKEIVQFLKNQPQNEDIFVGTEGTFGLLPYAFHIYFFGNTKIHITGFWPVNENKLPQQIMEASGKNKTYFVFNENQKEITNPNLKLIAKYQKGKGSTYMRLYEVIPQ